MTRGHYPPEKRTWGFYCDNDSCDTVVGPRPTQGDFPLAEFRDLGWFIAEVFGDRCPKCVAAGDVLPWVPEWKDRMTAFSCGRCGDDSEPADCPDRHGFDDHGLCCMGTCDACQHRIDQGEDQ